MPSLEEWNKNWKEPDPNTEAPPLEADAREYKLLVFGIGSGPGEKVYQGTEFDGGRLFTFEGARDVANSNIGYHPKIAYEIVKDGQHVQWVIGKEYKGKNCF